MKTDRLCVARALVFVVCGALLMIVYRFGFESSSGPVWGTVRLNGKPVTTGAVVFVPIGDRAALAASARIDREGSYAVPTAWRRPDGPAARYRICIIPARRQNLTASAERDQRLPRIVPVSFSSAPRGVQDGPASFPVPPRFRNFQTSDLEVNLDQESARIDIDLKD
jgi:hypothetical protein